MKKVHYTLNSGIKIWSGSKQKLVTRVYGVCGRPILSRARGTTDPTKVTCTYCRRIGW